jgi:hypothetical protein
MRPEAQHTDSNDESTRQGGRCQEDPLAVVDASQQVAVELSELLRRIAIARLGRTSAAGLSGADWLSWLKQHDPAGFDWSRFGKPLLTLPYAPPGKNEESVDQLLVLIDAALVWVEKARRGQHV